MQKEKPKAKLSEHCAEFSNTEYGEFMSLEKDRISRDNRVSSSYLTESSKESHSLGVEC